MPSTTSTRQTSSGKRSSTRGSGAASTTAAPARWASISARRSRISASTTHSKPRNDPSGSEGRGSSTPLATQSDRAFEAFESRLEVLAPTRRSRTFPNTGAHESVQPRERRLRARAVGGVLPLREAGRERRNDRAKLCRSGIWCDELDASWRHEEVGGPPDELVSPVTRDGDEADAAACGERPRANDAADANESARRCGTASRGGNGGRTSTYMPAVRPCRHRL